MRLTLTSAQSEFNNQINFVNKMRKTSYVFGYVWILLHDLVL